MFFRGELWQNENMPARTRIAPTCRACGYDVSGIAPQEGAGDEGRLTAVCPECGTTFDPRRPWLLPPWTGRWRIAGRMVLPLAIAMPLIWIGRGGPVRVLGVRALGTGGIGAGTGWVDAVVTVVAFVVAIAGAIVVVTTMTDRHLPMPQGKWIKGGLVVLSLAVNVGGLVIVMALM